MKTILKVGTRASRLALKQVDEIIKDLKRFAYDTEFDVITIDTYGDRDKDTPISDIEGSDFFTREIDEALLKREIDFAVHSAKDLPERMKEGLEIAFTTESIDLYDCLVSRSGLKLDGLPCGARIGTSSERRKTQLRKYRSDFQIVDIRGTIEERLNLLDDDESRTRAEPPRRGRKLDAIVIAAVALIRLGLEHRITQRIPFEILRPHPLQGSLAIVIRKGSNELTELLNRLENAPSLPGKTSEWKNRANFPRWGKFASSKPAGLGASENLKT